MDDVRFMYEFHCTEKVVGKYNYLLFHKRILWWAQYFLKRLPVVLENEVDAFHRFRIIFWNLGWEIYVHQSGCENVWLEWWQEDIDFNFPTDYSEIGFIDLAKIYVLYCHLFIGIVALCFENYTVGTLSKFLQQLVPGVGHLVVNGSCWCLIHTYCLLHLY